MQLTLPNSIDQWIDSAKDINLSHRQQQTVGIITAATVVTSYVFYKLWFKTPKDGCPTVPYSNPLYGSSAEYRKDPHSFVQKWTEKLGPVYHVHLFGRMQTVVSGRYVREIFMNNNFDFNTGIEKRFDMKAVAGIPHDDVPAGITRDAVVKYLTPHLKQFTPRAVENLHIGLKEVLGDVNEPVDLPHLYPLVQHMVARASAAVFVGEKLCQDKELVSAFQNITIDIGSMIRTNSWLEPFTWFMKLRMWAIGKFSPRVKEYRKTMLRALTPEIDSRLKSSQDPTWQKPNDILQDIIDHAEVPYDNTIYNNIVNQMMVLIFASIHTTSENGTIILYRVLQNPKLMDDLLEEQQHVLERLGLDLHGNSSEVFTFDAIKNMEKLDSICRESLRLRNDFYELPHSNIGSDKVVLSNGTIIKPGSDVLINAWYNQQSNSWEGMSSAGDRSEFKPYRFVQSGYPSTKVGDDYLVFGEGRHACPGRWFAIQEVKTVVALLVRDFKIHPTSDVLFPSNIDTAMPFGTVRVEKRSLD